MKMKTSLEFISVFNQLDTQNLFHNKFYFMALHVTEINILRCTDGKTSKAWNILYSVATNNDKVEYKVVRYGY